MWGKGGKGWGTRLEFVLCPLAESSRPTLVKLTSTGIRMVIFETAEWWDFVSSDSNDGKSKIWNLIFRFFIHKEL